MIRMTIEQHPDRAGEVRRVAVIDLVPLSGSASDMVYGVVVNGVSVTSLRHARPGIDTLLACVFARAEVQDALDGVV